MSQHDVHDALAPPSGFELDQRDALRTHKASDERAARADASPTSTQDPALDRAITAARALHFDRQARLTRRRRGGAGTWALLSIAAHVALGGVLTLIAPRAPVAPPEEVEIVFNVRTRPIVREDPLPALLRETRSESLEELREHVPSPSEATIERTASNLDELLAAESPQSARAERSLDSSEFARARELSPSTMARHLLPRVASAAPGDAPPPSLAIASAPVAPDAPDASASARSVHTPARPASELNAPVRFPSSALRLGLQGTALLAVDVDREGHVTAIALLRSSGHDSLDRAALEAVRAWRFVPARDGAEPVASRVEVPVTFRIDPR